MLMVNCQLKSTLCLARTYFVYVFPPRLSPLPSQADELTPGFGQMSLSRQGSSEAPEPPGLYQPPPAVLSQHPPPQPGYIIAPPPSSYQPPTAHPHPPPPAPPPSQPVLQTAPPAQGYMQPPPPPQQVHATHTALAVQAF